MDVLLFAVISLILNEDVAGSDSDQSEIVDQEQRVKNASDRMRSSETHELYQRCCESAASVQKIVQEWYKIAISILIEHQN